MGYVERHVTAPKVQDPKPCTHGDPVEVTVTRTVSMPKAREGSFALVTPADVRRSYVGFFDLGGAKIALRQRTEHYIVDAAGNRRLVFGPGEIYQGVKATDGSVHWVLRFNVPDNTSEKDLPWYAKVEKVQVEYTTSPGGYYLSYGARTRTETSLGEVGVPVGTRDQYNEYAKWLVAATRVADQMAAAAATETSEDNASE